MEKRNIFKYKEKKKGKTFRESIKNTTGLQILPKSLLLCFLLLQTIWSTIKTEIQEINTRIQLKTLETRAGIAFAWDLEPVSKAYHGWQNGEHSDRLLEGTRADPKSPRALFSAVFSNQCLHGSNAALLLFLSLRDWGGIRVVENGETWRVR